MKIEIEKIKQVLNGIIDLIAYHQPSTTVDKFKESKINALKTILNQTIEPIQPEGYQGLNKWYLTELGSVIYAVSINEFSCYGLLKSENKWATGFSLQKGNIKRLATESEKIEAIKKGLEQKGIVEGARVKCLSTNNEIVLTEFHDVVLTNDSNSIWIYPRIDVVVKVFDNGTFAEVVKEEKKDKHKQWQEAIELEQKTLDNILENSSDKELLKECYDYLFYVKRKSFLFSQEVVLDVLLARINEVIKPS